MGKIDARNLTAILVGVVEKTYDGTTAATLNLTNYQLQGVVAGDNVGLNLTQTYYSQGTYGSKDAGSGILVTVKGLTLVGKQAGNYTVNGVAANYIGKIDPKTLTATLIGTVSKAFDGTTAAHLTSGNYSLTGGIIAGDLVGLNNPAAGTYAAPAVGTGIRVTVTGVALTGRDAGDYAIPSSNLTGNVGVITAPKGCAVGFTTCR